MMASRRRISVSAVVSRAVSGAVWGCMSSMRRTLSRRPALAKAVTVKGPNNILFYHGQSTFTDVSPTLKRSGPHEETSPGGGDKTTSVSVIEIEGFPKPTGCQVHVTEIVESTTRRNGQIVSTQTSRDRRADLEIEIVGMFDPQTAARILREGEEARASGEWYPPKKK